MAVEWAPVGDLADILHEQLEFLIEHKAECKQAIGCRECRAYEQVSYYLLRRFQSDHYVMSHLERRYPKRRSL